MRSPTHSNESDLLIHFYGLAVKTGSRPIALQKFFKVFFRSFFAPKMSPKNIFFGSFFFQIRLKNLMGHDVLNFVIFLQVFE